MKIREQVLKRITAVILSAVMVTGAVTGCGKNKADEDNLVNQAARASKDYVFKAEKVDFLPEGDYNSLKMAGDRVYTSTYSESGFINIYSFNPDGSDVQTLRLSEKDNESHGYIDFDKDGNMYCLHSIYDWSDYEDEEIELYEDGEDTGEEDTGTEDAASEEPAGNTEAGAEEEAQDTDPEAPDTEEHESDMTEVDGDQQYLVKFDSTGKELFSVDLKEYFDDDEYYGTYSLVYVDGIGVIVSTENGLERYDEAAGKLVTLVNVKDNSSEYYGQTFSIYHGGNDKLFVTYWGDNGMVLSSFDPRSGKIGEPSKTITGYNEYSFFAGNGYDLFVSSNVGFFGYDEASDTLTKILDYMDSDIGITGSTSSAVALSVDEFLANVPDEEYNYSLYRFTKIPPDQVKDRKIVTLAGNYISYDIRQKAALFNQQSDEYRIKVVDYSSLGTEEDWNAGGKQMNLDIAAGNIPDIMLFDADNSISSFINKGLFVDLNTLMANDPEFKDAKFVESVINALSTGDKLYQLPESFNVQSVATKTRYLQGRTSLTIKDCDDLIKQAGIDYAMSYGLCSREQMLTAGLAAAGTSYIDWEKKSCNFDSDAFVEFLEFVNKFPEEIKESDWEDYKDSCYRDGTALFDNAYIYSFRAYKRIEAGAFGEDITMVGYPNDLGKNCSMISPNNRFTISAQSKNIDGAWSFVREFFTKEAQDKIEYDFPVLQSSFDKMGEASMEREFYIDENGKKQYEDDSYYIGDTEIKIDPLTREELEEVKQFVYSIDNIYDYNESVFNIINEEVSAYFSGQKSAEEVAKIIQSRVSIYVNENS